MSPTAPLTTIAGNHRGSNVTYRARESRRHIGIIRADFLIMIIGRILYSGGNMLYCHENKRRGIFMPCIMRCASSLAKSSRRIIAASAAPFLLTAYQHKRQKQKRALICRRVS